jgi:hypothetical protein
MLPIREWDLWLGWRGQLERAVGLRIS